MAAASSATSSDARLSLPSALLCCAACGGSLDAAVLLPCLHSLCRLCFDRLLPTAAGGASSSSSSRQLRKVECPSCRCIGAARPNTFLAAAAGGGDAPAPPPPQLLCDTCQKVDDPVVCRCTECNQFFCAGCRRWHDKFKKSHAGAVIAAGDASGSGSADSKVNAAPIAAHLVPPRCASEAAHCSDSSSLDAIAATAPVSDSFCSTCAVPLCTACRSTCERDGHDVTVATAAGAAFSHCGGDDLGLAAEKIAHLARQSLAGSLDALSSSLATLAEEGAPLPSSSADGQSAGAVGSGRAAVAAASTEALNADLRRLEANESAVISAVRQAFARARSAVERRHTADQSAAQRRAPAGAIVASSSSTAAASASRRKKNLEERIGLLIAYGRALAASGGAADVLDQQPVVGARARTLLAQVESEVAAAAAVAVADVGPRDGMLACSHVAAIDSSVELAEAVASHTLRQWTGMLHSEAGEQHALPAADDRFAQPVRGAKRHSSLSPVRDAVAIVDRPASTAALTENVFEVLLAESVSEARMDGTNGVMTTADNVATAGVRVATDAAAVVSGATASRAAGAAAAGAAAAGAATAAAAVATTTAAAAGPAQSSQSPVAVGSSNSAAVTAPEAEVQVTVNDFDAIHQKNMLISQPSDPVATELEASSERQSFETDCVVAATTNSVSSIATATDTATATSDQFAAADEGHVLAGGSVADGGGSSSDDSESRPLLLRTASTDDWAMFTCCSCRGVLDEPVLLACLHSCCNRCLGDLSTSEWHLQAAAAGQRSVTCARCQATTALPVAGDGMPEVKLNGFTAARLRAMHIAAGLAKCDLCVQAGSGRSMSQQQTTIARDAAHQCADCAKLLCDDCLRWHRRFNGGRHRVEPIAAAVAIAGAAAAGQPSSAVVYAVQCESHGSKRDLYCTVCERLKCIECAKLPCMEARHEIIVADKDGAAELLRNVAKEIRDKCGELARWLAAEREEAVLSGEASAVGADDSSMTVSDEGVRQENPELSPTELATKALKRSTEAVNAAYALLGKRSEESAKRAVVLTQEARRAVAYCSALLDCEPVVATDNLPVVKQQLDRLLAEVRARLAVTPDSVEPGAFSLVERHGEPKKALVMAASASAAPAAAGGRNSTARSDVRGAGSSSNSVGTDVEGADSRQAYTRGADDDNDVTVSLKCTRCSKDPADEPLLLACLHGSCCRRCVGFDHFARGEAEPISVTCDECGHVTDAKTLRSSSLAVALNRTAPIVADDGERGFPACHTCLEGYRQTAARNLCADCGYFMCQACRRHHDKFNVSHKVVPAEATVESRRQATEIVAAAAILCPEDSEKYDVYCRTCERLRCCSCAKRCIAAKHSVSSDLRDLPESQHHVTALKSRGDRLQSQAALLAERANAAVDGLRAGRALKADLENLLSAEQRLVASLAARAGLPVAAARAPAANTGQRRQLCDRVRHAIHYSRSLLAFAEATAAAACCLLEQHADVLRCVRQLLVEVRAAPGAAATHLDVASGSSISPSLHVGGWEDVVARYQQEIGIVREGVDDILSEPTAEAIAADSAAGVDLSTKAGGITESGSSVGSSASVRSDSSATGKSGRVESAIGGGYGSSSSSNATSDRVSAGNRSSSAAKTNRSGRQDDGDRDGGSSAMSSIENAIINDIQDDDDDSPSDGESLTLVTDAEAAEAGLVGGSSFETNKEARDVAITSDGRVLVAILWGGIAEYAGASGKLLSSWKPPQFEEGADCASSVDVLEDGVLVVGLIGSQSVALLRRQPHDDKGMKAGGDRGSSDADDDDDNPGDSPWELESNYMLPVAPWCVSGRSDVLAAIGAVEVQSDSGRSWRSGPYLCLTRRADGHTLLTHTLAYSAESVALTGLGSVVVLSSEEHPIDGGRRLAHVAEAFDLDGVPLWYAESGGAGDVCASPSGSTLYLALPKEHRVRAIGAADGRSEGDALTRHDRGLRQPLRVAMASAGEGASGGSSTSSFAAVAVLTAGDDGRKVLIYPARMSHGDL